MGVVLTVLYSIGDVDDHTDPIVIIHYQLLCNITRRPIDMENWMFVGAKVSTS